MRLWVKRGLKNNAPSESPPATPQIELSTLPRAVPYQHALPQIPEGAITKTADLQNLYRLRSEPAVRPTTRRGPRPPGEATSAAAHDINVHNLDDAVEEARVDTPERIARLPREPTTEEREARGMWTRPFQILAPGMRDGYRSEPPPWECWSGIRPRHAYSVDRLHVSGNRDGRAR